MKRILILQLILCLLLGVAGCAKPTDSSPNDQQVPTDPKTGEVLLQGVGDAVAVEGNVTDSSDLRYMKMACL